MFTALSVDAEKISDKHLEQARDRVATVRSLSDASMAELREAMIEAFTRGRAFRESEYREAELERAAELAETRYMTDEWNFKR
jgi:Lipoate-protein ligase A